MPSQDWIILFEENRLPLKLMQVVKGPVSTGERERLMRGFRDQGNSVAVLELLHLIFVGSSEWIEGLNGAEAPNKKGKNNA